LNTLRSLEEYLEGGLGDWNLHGRVEEVGTASFRRQ
jgi:hypothetical protein